MRRNALNYFFGLVLIILGILLLIDSIITGPISFWAIFWPIFVFIPGLFFLALWRSLDSPKKNWGLLIPAIILIVLAITFFFNMLITELLHYSTIWAWTTFMYPGAVAIAFWASWTVIGSRLLLTVAKILGLISLGIFTIVDGLLVLAIIFSANTTRIFWPIILILIGLVVIFSSSIWQLFWKDGRYFGKTEEEWRKWGENFGKQIEAQGEELKEKTKQ